MLNISKYLEKFRKNLASGEDLNNNIILIINKHTGISINPNDFDIKNNIIYIKTTPSYKNKIFIFKEDILKELNQLSKIIDIR